MKESYFIKPNYYVVFSEYDDQETGKGWYIQNCNIKGWPSSDLYETEEALIKDFNLCKLVWTD